MDLLSYPGRLLGDCSSEGVEELPGGDFPRPIQILFEEASFAKVWGPCQQR